MNAKLDQHINDCPVCREEFSAFLLIWDIMGEIHPPEPSDDLKINFQTMLNGFIAAKKGGQ
jgi:hypothetical protein